MITIRRVEHKGYAEINAALQKAKTNLNSVISNSSAEEIEFLKKLSSSPTLPRRWQWIYKNDVTGDEISMIHIKGMLNYEDIWEVFAFENPKLFTDIRRFDTKLEAETFIYQQLEGGSHAQSCL